MCLQLFKFIWLLGCIYISAYFVVYLQPLSLVSLSLSDKVDNLALSFRVKDSDWLIHFKKLANQNRELVFPMFGNQPYIFIFGVV